MKSNSRRNFFARLGALAASMTGATKIFAQKASAPAVAAPGAAGDRERTDHHPRGGRHIQDGIYYFSGIGSNDGFPKEDHVLVTDPFEKHVTRTMDALRRSVERAGCTMDSIIHLDVFLCLPLADGITTPTGMARFDAHKAQYLALNKIYESYFTEGKTPSRACMAVEWIPGDSLVEIVGNAKVVNPTSDT